MATSSPRSVLFVCLGNICRSPAAEAVMLSESADQSAPIRVDSCGTDGYHIGDRADHRMRKAAANRGVDVTSIARQVMDEDLRPGRFDLVIAMDRSNLARLHGRAARIGVSKDHILLFSEFLDSADPSGSPWPDEVPDPYYGGEDGFEYVLDMLEAGCPKILARLLG